MLAGTSSLIYGQNDRELKLITYNGDTVAVFNKEEIKELLRYETSLHYEIDSLTIRVANLETAYETLVTYVNANEITLIELEEERDLWMNLFNMTDNEYDDLIKRCKKGKRAAFIKGALTGIVGGVLLVLLLTNG